MTNTPDPFEGGLIEVKICDLNLHLTPKKCGINEGYIYDALGAIAALTNLTRVFCWRPEPKLRWTARHTPLSKYGEWEVRSGEDCEARAYGLNENQAHAVAATLNGESIRTFVDCPKSDSWRRMEPSSSCYEGCSYCGGYSIVELVDGKTTAAYPDEPEFPHPWRPISTYDGSENAWIATLANDSYPMEASVWSTGRHRFNLADEPEYVAWCPGGGDEPAHPFPEGLG